MTSTQERLEKATERFNAVNIPFYIKECSKIMQGNSQIVGGCPLCKAAAELKHAEHEDFLDRVGSRR